ncbi:MAG: DNA-processing protein DprA [Patescibacteria group bacterium]|jgi:DNA processing protein|nr:DNA-processing protein DprA [Patescibacteria group bacterium]
MNKEKLSCLIIAYFNKFTFKQEQILLKIFKSYTNILNANFKNLDFPPAFNKKLYEFKLFINSFNLNKTLKYLQKEDINFVCRFENNYPKNLKEIYNPPLVLFYKGYLENINIPCLAIIGTRLNSSYGEKIVPYIIKDLKNICIVSGLALGIDALAHKNALDYNLKTVAVLGSGLDFKSFYPKQNIFLMRKILQNNGIIISEYPPFTPPLKNNFRLRNRIVSGLSRAVLIIEAKERSGTRITANYALEQDRDVLAIPGSIFSEDSMTCNSLISQGAMLIKNGEDINNLFNSYLTGP